MVLTLIHPRDLPDAQRIIAVAALAGVKLKLLYITEGEENASLPYVLNCHPLGKVPVLKTDEGYLFGANAVVRYLARTESITETRYPHPEYYIPYKLYGKTLLDAALVDSWLDFAATELDPSAAPFFTKFGVKKKKLGAAATTPVPSKKEIQVVVDALHEALTGLNNRLSIRKEEMKLSEAKRLHRMEEGLDDDIDLEDGDLYPQSQDVSVFNGSSATAREAFSMIGSDSVTPRSARHRDPSSASYMYSMYNVNGRIKSIHHERASIAEEALMRYGRSTSMTPSAMQTPRTGRERNSFVFLVGDSLTAADVVVAFSLQLIFRVPELGKRTEKEFSNVYTFYRSIMMLPLVAEVRRALFVDIGSA